MFDLLFAITKVCNLQSAMLKKSNEWYLDFCGLWGDIFAISKTVQLNNETILSNVVVSKFESLSHPILMLTKKCIENFTHEWILCQF